jgi:hypothetical protein
MNTTFGLAAYTDGFVLAQGTHQLALLVENHCSGKHYRLLHAHQQHQPHIAAAANME